MDPPFHLSIIILKEQMVEITGKTMLLPKVLHERNLTS